MIEVTVTADGLYWFDSVYFGKTLDELVNEMHEYVNEVNGWDINKGKIKKGCYGYETYACIIGFIMEKFKTFHETLKDEDGDVKPLQEIVLKEEWLNEEKMSILVHRAWKKLYVYWRDNKPWMWEGQSKRYKPYNLLGDERRDKHALMSFEDLPLEEKEKDLILAKFLVNFLIKVCQ